MEYTIRSEARQQAIACLNAAHTAKRPDARHLFTDVYDEPTWALEEQQAALKAQIHRYREHYGYVADEQLEGM